MGCTNCIISYYWLFGNSWWRCSGLIGLSSRRTKNSCEEVRIHQHVSVDSNVNFVCFEYLDLYHMYALNVVLLIIKYCYLCLKTQLRHRKKRKNWAIRSILSRLVIWSLAYKKKKPSFFYSIEENWNKIRRSFYSDHQWFNFLVSFRAHSGSSIIHNTTSCSSNNCIY